MTLPRVAVGAMARLYLLANTHDTRANFHSQMRETPVHIQRARI